ncbi:hypothetical protein TRV_07469 [Trichophyton verrucosum HKI 0517]|uniref:Uncharacterized protein n=1 Tax=Trichophyton verrucosum (strain HKI 0517) TaxID=663202 RepID=D4DJV1_TRIVH|nr:uncharacterized protein TRV_07469 [Trichophyton verrucosum HKI 0517]EFE37878.1 hypothetical protein TRV_07469 [Trichophyton verrucosum HKI 0517]
MYPEAEEVSQELGSGAGHESAPQPRCRAHPAAGESGEEPADEGEPPDEADGGGGEAVGAQQIRDQGPKAAVIDAGDEEAKGRGRDPGGLFLFHYSFMA